jgi:hypothetical protein
MVTATKSAGLAGKARRWLWRKLGVLVRTLVKWAKRNRKRLLWAVVTALLAFATETLWLSAPPMEIFLQEADVSIPAGAGAGVALEPEFIAKVTALDATLPHEKVHLPQPILSLIFDTSTPGACRAFHFVYSARDRGNANAPPRITIRPRAPAGSNCIAKLDAKWLSFRRHLEIPADTDIELRLASAPADPLFDHLAVGEIRGDARKTNGGPFSLTQTEVEVDKPVQVGGEGLELRTLSVSNDVPDGELHAVLVSKRVPAVRVDGNNVSRLYRLKIVMKIRDTLTKLGGHSP